MSEGNKETTHIRINRVDMKRLWDLISFERKTIADVITYLLNHHSVTSVGCASQPVMVPLESEG